MKKAIIFTDDSGVKLPEIHRWKHIIGTGYDIRNSPKVLDALKKANLDIPEKDITDEGKYRKALSEFIRPARLMFAGMFGEVRIFHDKLKKILPTELYIISGRYGLIRDDEEIIPYSAHIGNVDDLEKLNNKTQFINAMLALSNDKQFIIMCLPIHYFKFLIKEGWFRRIIDEHLFFIVTGADIRSELSSYPNIKLFEKRGVARIGKDYQTRIIGVIESEIKDKEEK